MCGPPKRAPYVETRSADQMKADAKEYQAYSNAVNASASSGGGIGAGGVKDFEQPGFVKNYETDVQRRVREGLLALKTTPGQAAPDLGDAVLASYARSNLLKNRNQSAGRKGSFLTGAPGDLTAPGPSSRSMLGER